MSETTPSARHKGTIAWFTRNPVAANLLMILIFIVGGHAAYNIQRSIIPMIEPNVINISMAYPGAAPEDVERGIILKIEESLKDIESIKRVESTASESFGSVYLTLYENFDIFAVMDEVKSAVDAISSFPEESEKAVIKRFRLEEQAVFIQLYGNMDEVGLKSLTEDIKDELLQDPDIASAEILGARDYEISVEVTEITLRKYNLTLEQVAQAIRQSSVDLPGGSVKTENGDILLRTKGQGYQQYDFEKMVLITQPDGTRLTLGDIATINDGFVETTESALFDKKFSMSVRIMAIGDQDVITVARAAKAYVKKKRNDLPPGISIDYWADVTYYLEGRLNMLLKNLALGALLVFIILALFLDIKLAFWVMAGLPVCFLGTFIFMPLEFVDITLNMVSLFGFILILGIVVDDAIIIGESAYSATEKHGHSVENVIAGTLKVATPATFGVLTTIVAFMPNLFLEGFMAAFPKSMGWVVIFCLIFSLIESKWILPSHLAHSRPSKGGILGLLNKIPTKNNRRLNHFIQNRYLPMLMICIRNRYTTFAVFAAMLILVAGLVSGGIVRYVLFPAIPSDFLNTQLKMVEGTPDWQTQEANNKIVNAMYELENRYKLDTGNEEGLINHIFSYSDGRSANSMMELTKAENRSMTSNEISDQWRQLVGDIPGAKVLAITNVEGFGGPAVAFKLIGPDITILKQAGTELEQKLATYNGTYDIRNNASTNQDDIILSIKPKAEVLGITLADLGRQVRHAFYGAEAQRIQRETNEIKVMVRYPKTERTTIASLENMYIRTPQGDEVPFSAVAEVNIVPGYSQTTRINGERAIKVSTEVNKEITEPSAVTNDIKANFMPELLSRYPGVSYKLDGESEEAGKLFGSLFVGLAVALLGIYALLAIPLKSYLQPLIIMSVIPFGIIGAIVGHIIIGISFSMMSFFGIIALSGVVVNDSLIMVDFVNKSVAKGMDKFDAVIHSGARRFRAILITSLTTFFGLLPMLLETSLQAQEVIPMAVSLSFGIIFATVITLFLVPCLYMALDDVTRLWQRWQGQDADRNSTQTETPA